jgi:putative transposase
VQSRLIHRRTNPAVDVPWSGFDLINAFNNWKRSEEAGRVLAVGTDGQAQVVVTGLSWRSDVHQQVFEEAAVDCARALAAWSDSRRGKRKGKGIGFPRFKKKSASASSFRLRNKRAKGRPPTIRVGDTDARSVTLPGIGTIPVRDNTRRLRRMLASDRARILFATVRHQAGRWWVSLNVEAADLHPALVHPVRDQADAGGWVGVDRGLLHFIVAAGADGAEVARVSDAPKSLRAGLNRQRRLARNLSRKQRGSINRHKSAARLARHHRHVVNVRRHFLHQVSNALVKNHDRLVIENLNVLGMLRNHRLAQAISDAGWGEFARILDYKQQWRGGHIAIADRWFPSSKQCSACGKIHGDMTLADRTFDCDCGYSADRDLNAAINLARWGQTHYSIPDPQARGRVTNARRREGAGGQSMPAGAISPDEAGTDVHAADAV